MIKFHNAWDAFFEEEEQQLYFQSLISFLREEYANYTCYPNKKDVFRLFKMLSPDEVKVVILGQDPYHGPGQAHGLCFSVPEGIVHPPSLKNIFTELKNDCGKIRTQGDLTDWVEQGVFLLNAVLTVRAGQAGSHANKGWEILTDRVIQTISKSPGNRAFILWGGYAQSKIPLIDSTRHLVLKAPHPSPLSAHRGFFGSKPFSKANKFLLEKGYSPIVWA